MAIFEERKVKTSILITLTIAFLCIGLIPLLFSNWRIISLNRERLQTNLQESFGATASTVSSRIGTYLTEYRTVQVDLAAKAENNMDTLDLSPTLKDPNIIEVRIWYPNGKYRYAHRISFDDPRVTEMQEEAYKSAMRGEAFLGRPYHDRADNQTVLILGEAIRDVKDNVVGAVTFVLDCDPLLKIIHDESSGGTLVYVVDQDGNLMLHPNLQVMDEKPNLSDSAIVQDYLKTHGLISSVRQYSEKQGNKTVEILGSYASIEDTQWGAIIQINKDIAFKTVNDMIRASMQWGLFFALAAAVVGFIFARWMTNPIKALAEHALDVGRHQNFDKKIRINASNEIQQLADTFNYMTDEIKQNILRLQAAARENKELFMSSIRMLAAAIDAKDPYTRGHSERVKEYSLVIGRHLNFSSVELDRLEICALLHDVGKIGIDDRILRKPTNLTPEEFEIMKTHPDKGAAILSQIEQLKDIIPGMRAHHENYDGSGYPMGLKGSEIPILGRVITVADTFDAMTTDRPYQKAFTLEFALNRIRTMSAIKYDPDIVDAFGRACEDGKLTLAKPSRPRPKQPVV